MMSLRVLFLKSGGLLAGLAPLLIQRMPGQKGYLVMSLCVAAGCAAGGGDAAAEDLVHE